MSSSANSTLKGTVKFPSVHLCLSSFTCVHLGLKKRVRLQTGTEDRTGGPACPFLVSDVTKRKCYQRGFVQQYLQLELLPPGVVNQE